MSKGNPIVGLAYVVTSQQEMLEETNCKIAKMKYDYEKRIDEIKSENVDLRTENAELNKQCEEKDATISEIRTELSETKEELQKEREQGDNDSEFFDNKLFELEQKLKRARSSSFHWQKWEEGKEYPLDIFGNVPEVDGLYLFNDKSERSIWSCKENRNVSLAGKYSANPVEILCTPERRDRGVFTIAPYNPLLADATLVAVSIRSMAEATALDSMPELIDDDNDDDE